MGHVLCPHSGVCQPLLCPTGCLPVCPGRKGLTCPDFLSAVLEGKVTCRREWREGDLQNCFARHVLGVGKALSEAEPQIQLEFGLSGQNLSAEVTPFSCGLPDLFTTSLCHCRGGPGRCHVPTIALRGGRAKSCGSKVGAPRPPELFLQILLGSTVCVLGWGSPSQPRGWATVAGKGKILVLVLRLAR